MNIDCSDENIIINLNIFKLNIFSWLINYYYILIQHFVQAFIKLLTIHKCMVSDILNFFFIIIYDSGIIKCIIYFIPFYILILRRLRTR